MGNLYKVSIVFSLFVLCFVVGLLVSRSQNALASGVITEELEWNCWSEVVNSSGKSDKSRSTISPFLQVYRSKNEREIYFSHKDPLRPNNGPFKVSLSRSDSDKLIRLVGAQFKIEVQLFETKTLLRSPSSSEEPVYLSGKFMQEGQATEVHPLVCWIKGEMPETVTDLESVQRPGSVSEL